MMWPFATLYCMGGSVRSNEEVGVTGWHRPLERSWKIFKKNRRTRSHYSNGFNTDKDAGQTHQSSVSTSINEDNFDEGKHAHKEASTHGDCCSETSDFSWGTQFTPVQSPVTPTFGSWMTTDDFHVFNTSPRTLVRSLQESSPESESKKLQSRSKFANVDCDASRDAIWSGRDSPDASIKDDESRVRKQGRAILALKGKMLFQQLESLANEVSYKSNAHEGDLQESTSLWSHGVRQSESVSSASSRILCFGNTDKQGHLSTSVQAVVEKQNHGFKRGEDGSLKTDANSVEDSSICVESEGTSLFTSGWTKALSFMELILRGSLCVVLAIPAAMIVIKSFTMQEEYHVLVPT